MITCALTVLALSLSPAPTIKDVWSAAKQGGFSGGVIVVSGDQIVLADTNNVANSKSLHLNQQTLLPVCSITKGMTAEVILDLAAEGKLSLDDTVSTHLDWLPNFAGKPTIRQLLTHTSGLANMNNAGEKGPDGISTIYTSRDQAIQPLKARILLIVGDKPVAEPGSNYDYSNTDFLILQAIVEKVTGKSLESELRHRIFGPAGLKSTRFPAWNEAPVKYVNCFERKNGKESILKPFNLATYGAGGSLLSNPADLARWMKFSLNSKMGARWLEAGSQFGGFQGFGCYALNVTDQGSNSIFRPAVERPGAINGYTLQVSFLPKQKIAVAAFTNLADQQLGSIWEGKGLVFDLLQAAVPRS